MDFYSTMEILSSSLAAERVRMNTTASNLANAQTTRTEEGGPYKRRDPVFKAAPVNAGDPFASALDSAINAVEVSKITIDQTPPRMIYDPKHPDANKEGFVAMPNINMVEEMINMMTASRSYEASVTSMKSVIDMAQKALSLGK